MGSNFPSVASPTMSVLHHSAFILYRNDKILKLIIKDGMNSQYQIRRFARVFNNFFINVTPTLICYIESLKNWIIAL